MTDMLYDSDAFDIEVKAQRLGADQFDVHAMARMLGVGVAAVRQGVRRGAIEPPDHYEDCPRGMAAIWTAEQAVRILDARAKTPNRPPKDAQPLRPCGTMAAYERHRRHGEPIDLLCRLAARRRSREQNAKRAAT